MKDEFELEIGPGGVIRTIYQDGIEDFAKEIGADITRVCRLSNVEWEYESTTGRAKGGWTVRAAHDPRYALRLSIKDGIVVSTEGTLCVFDTRDDALRAEADHIWLLLPPKKE